MIKSLFNSKDGSLFTTSLIDIQKNARYNLRSDFKDFIKQNVDNETLKEININKLVDKKLNVAENPIYQLTNDLFIRTIQSKSEKQNATTIESVVEKFKLDATKFLEEATPQEMKLLQNYYSKNFADADIIEKWLASTNKCTDGKDDGKIGFFSKVGNILEGSAKTIIGCAKEILTNPTKLAKLIIGGVITFLISMTPIGAIALPLIGLYTGGKLIYKGAKKIIENVKYASSATTDAEAKDRWENVGNGATQFAAGVIITRTSGKEACKLFKNGPKNIVNNSKDIARKKRQRFNKKNVEEKIKEIEKDIIKDPTNYVED